MFTSVATTRKRTRKLPAISDDVCHACFEIAKVQYWLDDSDLVHSEVTYVGDGAANGFKIDIICSSSGSLGIRQQSGCFPQLDMVKTHVTVLEDL